jgi:hypothetical protein
VAFVVGAVGLATYALWGPGEVSEQ